MTANTGKFRDLIVREHFPPPQWLTVCELQIPGSTSRADIIAVNTKSLEVVVCEIKVSRADLLHELKHPEKSAPALAAVDRHYLAVGDATLIKDGELPEGWGLLSYEGGSVKRLVPAPVIRQPGSESPYLSVLGAVLSRHLLDGGWLPGVLGRAVREGEVRGYRRGFAAAGKLNRVSGDSRKRRYDPANPVLDDGEPLDLP